MTCMPREPEVFGQPIRPCSSSTSRAMSATLQTSLQPNAGPGIEIDPQLVRVIEVLGPHRVRMEIDAGQVDDPQELGGVAQDDLVGGAPGGKAELDGLDPVRPLLRRPLLVEELLVDAVDVALEDERPAAGRLQRRPGDRQVVVGQVELGVAGRWKQDLVRVGDR